MQFGCTLPNRGELTSAENLKVMAQTAEKNGFDSVWVSDHIVIPTDIAPLYPYSDSGELPFNPDSPYCEPLTTLAFLSGVTSSVRLGTHVLVLPYRNPVLAAKMISTLDFLSGGRVILGIGAGWMEEEFEALDSPPFPHRGRVTDEYLELYRELWTNPNPEFKGEFAHASGYKFSPKPVQQPGPPIWVGGHSGPAIRRAARFGDAWLPIGLRGTAGLEPDELKNKIQLLASLTEKAGRDPASIKTCFSTDLGFEYGVDSSERRTLSGSPEQIAQDIRRYAEVGVGYFLFSYRSGSVTEVLESMEQFATEVRPLVA